MRCLSAGAEQTRAATTLRMNQTSSSIEAQCPGRDAEFPGQLGNAIIFVHRSHSIKVAPTIC